MEVNNVNLAQQGELIYVTSRAVYHLDGVHLKPYLLSKP